MRTTAHATLAILLGTLCGALTGCSQRPIYLVKAAGNEALASGDIAGARANYGEWAEREPANPEAHYAYGQALLAGNEPRRAREQFELAYRLSPSEGRYIDGLVDALVASDQIDAVYRILGPAAEDSATAADYIRLGRASARAGLPDEAQRSYRRAVAIEPRNPAAYRALAEFYRSLGNQPEEVRALRVLLGLEPLNAEVPARLRDLGQVPGPSFVLPPEVYVSEIG